MITKPSRRLFDSADVAFLYGRLFALIPSTSNWSFQPIPDDIAFFHLPSFQSYPDKHCHEATATVAGVHGYWVNLPCACGLKLQ